MNPGVALLANKSFGFSLYDFHLEGVSVEELATAYSLPETWVEERIEAVRLCPEVPGEDFGQVGTEASRHLSKQDILGRTFNRRSGLVIRILPLSRCARSNHRAAHPIAARKHTRSGPS